MQTSSTKASVPARRHLGQGKNSRRLLAAACLATLAGAPPVLATDFAWDPSATGGIQYGDGVWDATTANWTTNGGTSNTAWVNGTGNNATFSSSVTGTPPALVTVTLGANVSLQQITMGGGYNANVLINGGGLYSIAFGGGAPLISNNNTSKSLQIDAAISGGNLQKTNSGLAILSQNNTYTGTTIIQGNASAAGGVLQIGNGGTAGSLGTGSVVLQQAASQTGASTLRFSRSDAVTVSNNIAISDSANGGIIQQAGGDTLTLSGTQTLTGGVNYSIARTSAASGQDAVVSGLVTGAGSLTKSGTGALVLTGSNAYSGSTAVTAGTLLINGNQSSATGAISVATGATLGGTGSAGGSATISGTLAPGSFSVGSLSVGSLSLGAAATFAAELGRSAGTPVSDSVAATGSVSLASGANLKLTLGGGLTDPAIGNIFYLVNNDGSDAISGVFTQLNGAATTLSEGSLFTWNSGQWTITYQANFGTSFTGGNDIAIMAVPEPSAWALLGLGVSLALLRRRSRPQPRQS